MSDSSDLSRSSPDGSYTSTADSDSGRTSFQGSPENSTLDNEGNNQLSSQQSRHGQDEILRSQALPSSNSEAQLKSAKDSFVEWIERNVQELKLSTLVQEEWKKIKLSELEKLETAEAVKKHKENTADELQKLTDEASMADRPMGEQEQLNSLQELLGRYNATLTDVNAKLQDLAPNTDLTKLSRQADRVDQINRLFSETKSQVEILMKDVQKLAGYKMMFETLKQQLNSKMEDIEKKLSNLHQEHLSMEASNLELQRTFDEMQRSSYDGTLIWRIHPFKEKFADAEHGRQLSLYSPPFYSHPYGYKMQARIFLAGDGSGKGTHLSFFFLICKGDYDALLHWPFKLMVNLRILNSRDRSGKNDKVQKFKPDGGVSFQKPTTLMNQATGLPQFIRHEDLMDRGRGFVDENEDALYIAVVVNAEDETARPVVYKKIQ